MLFIALAFALGTADPATDAANRAVNEAVRDWGGCVGMRITELAYRPDTPEAVAETAATACQAPLDALRQASVPLMGEAEAAAFTARMRAGMLTDAARRIVAIRAGTLDQTAPVSVHARCVRQEADRIAFVRVSPERLADRAMAACAAEERAALAAQHPDDDEDTAARAARLHRNVRAMALRRIEDRRAGVR